MSAHYKPYKNDPDTEHLDWGSSSASNLTDSPTIRVHRGSRGRSTFIGGGAAGFFGPDDGRGNGSCLRNHGAYSLALATLLGAVCGLLIGYFASATKSISAAVVSSPTVSGRRSLPVTEERSVTDEILQAVDADNIRSFLRSFSSGAHLSGTDEDLSQAKELSELWKRHGLDKVDVGSYNVLLSYPDPERPNVVRIYDNESRVVFTSRSKEVEDPAVVPAYAAYSPPATLKGDLLVYCNYGLLSDFAFLTDKFKMNLTAKIILMRLGMLFIGEKVKNAERHGAAGVVLYPDPQDFIPPSYRNLVYPSTWWLPKHAIPRGTAVDPPDGDPSTPGYPSTDFAYRLPTKDASGLPKIPVHIISYGDAYHIIRHLGGKRPPPTWQGGLNVTYNVGPGFAHKNWSFEMEVHTANKYRRTYNVIGYIKGRVEPGR